MKTLLFVLPLIIFVACDDRKVDASKWQEEMKTHKFVKVTDGEIAADAMLYTEDVLSRLDSMGVLKTPPKTEDSLDNIISLVEKKELHHTGVKLCLVKQDNLNSCYPSVINETTPKGTVNKVEEIWEASKTLADSPQTFDAATPQFLKKGSFILSTWPVFEEGKLSGMWCMIFKRQIIVLNRIE